MIWVILYVLIVALATYGFVSAEIKFDEEDIVGFCFSPFRAIMCGVFWIVCAPVYGAYLASIWKFRKRYPKR